MQTRHEIKTVAPYFQEVVDGRKPFEFRINDRDYKGGDIVIHHEYDKESMQSTGRKFTVMVGYVLQGGVFGIPEGYCIFAQYADWHNNPLWQLGQLQDKILPKYESKLNWRNGGDVYERVNHILATLESSTEQSIVKAKEFMQDCKLQLKAIELMLDGLAQDTLNHGQKRVIVNHVISILRKSVDRLDNIEYNFHDGVNERYNFFRSNSPEQSLLRKYLELKREVESLRGNNTNTDIPF